jgi:arylsulfatase B
LLEEFSFIDDRWRQLMHAMVYQVDINMGIIVNTLKKTGLWDNSIIVVFHSDNGGEIMAQLCGKNNRPLHGGKFSNFEGGIRVNGFISGGYLPESRRGKRVDALISAADFYSTYAEIAGVVPEDVVDEKAEMAALLPY